MTKNFFIQAMAKFFAGVILVGALLFLPAWTINYPQGWLLMGILFVPMFIAGLVMMAKNPSLLQSRLNRLQNMCVIATLQNRLPIGKAGLAVIFYLFAVQNQIHIALLGDVITMPIRTKQAFFLQF